ncbi:MAG: hypothetical protein LBR07_01370 [Puniceicoccales bacterium]|jgi:hypothetical protein|nr:hypothetical protein [Puniceicoccales bacterium]
MLISLSTPFAKIKEWSRGVFAGGGAALLAGAALAFAPAVSDANAAAGTVAALATPAVNWEQFLSRSDPVWTALPRKFDHGAFLGNGLLGTTIFVEGKRALRFEIGRSDVTDHRRDNGRLPIGGLLLRTAGDITGGSLRTSLFNAEVTGTITTTAGEIRFRAFTHADEIALLAEFDATGGEAFSTGTGGGVSFAWDAATASVFRDESKRAKITPNPQPVSGGDASSAAGAWCEQGRVAGGGYATAWRVQSDAEFPNRRRLTLTVADVFSRAGDVRQEARAAREVALAEIARISAVPLDVLTASHRRWWSNYYPASFVTIPDAQIEGFYWNQIYKLASATRRDRQLIDLLGPWYRRTGWPRVWWNLNIQLAYSPVYAANRLELGESFTRFVDAKRANFFKNAKDMWGFDDCATVPHTTDYEGLRGDGTCAPAHYVNPGDFTWALHLYWQQYRYSMNHEFITDTRRHAFVPLLKASVNLYLKLLKPAGSPEVKVPADGPRNLRYPARTGNAALDDKLHLPILHSPEYGNDSDNNYNLALLRWGCETLIALDKRYNLRDPQRAEWERVLRDLTPAPVDANGLRIGATIPFTRSHRHWSHILGCWPLHTLTTDQPANRELVEKSIRHWLTVGKAREVFGWSRAAACALYSTLGDADAALAQLRGHHNTKVSVMPNTQYIEGSPVIECSIAAAQSLHYMLLQSWGDTLRILPAAPAVWRDLAFHNLRAEGAFLVSAQRRDGKLRWVRIRSLAGEPCVVRADFGDGKTGVAGATGDANENKFHVSNPAVRPVRRADGAWELRGLTAGTEVVLYRDPADLSPAAPVALPAGNAPNFWGLKKTPTTAADKKGTTGKKKK